MVKQFFLLLRLFLRLQLNLSVLRDKRRHDRRALLKIVMIGVGVVLGACTILLSYSMILYLIMRPALEAGLGPVVLGLVFLLCMAMALILGTITMVSSVFGARDIELYASLPLSPRAVFMAKLGVVYLLELATALFFVLPAIAFYAAYTPTTVWFWLACLVVVPLLPVIPMVLSALLSILLLRLTARARRRELFMVAGGFVLIALLVFMQSQLNALFSSAAQESGQIMTLLTNNQLMLRAATAAFPPAMWAANALTLSGPAAPGYLGLYLANACIGVSLLTLLGGKAFYRGALAQLETPKRTPRRAARRSAARSRSVLSSLYIREWRVLLRTGVYALNALSGIVVFPLVFVILPLTTRSSGGMELLLDLATSPQAAPWLAPIAALVMCMPALINPAASTALSREGKQFWQCRSLPIPMRVQVNAKLMCALTVSLLGILIMSAAMLFFMSLPLDALLYALPIALPASAAMTIVSMIPDVMKPKLSWNNENEAVKQNVNSLLGMLLAFIPLLLGLVPVLLGGFSTPILSLVLAGFFTLVSVVCWRLLAHLADGRLETREV